MPPPTTGEGGYAGGSVPSTHIIYAHFYGLQVGKQKFLEKSYKTCYSVDMDETKIIPYLRAFSTLTRKEQGLYVILLAVPVAAEMTAARLADTLSISTRALSRLKRKIRAHNILHKTLPI